MPVSLLLFSKFPGSRLARYFVQAFASTLLLFALENGICYFLCDDFSGMKNYRAFWPGMLCPEWRPSWTPFSAWYKIVISGFLPFVLIPDDRDARIITLLLDKLEQIRDPSSPEHLQESLSTILGHVRNCSKRVKTALVEAGALDVILEAMMHKGKDTVCLYRYYLDILSNLIDSERVSTKVIDKGGVDSTIVIMESYASDEDLKESCLILLGHLLKYTTNEKRFKIVTCTFVEKLLQVMKIQHQSTSVYNAACLTLGVALGPGPTICRQLLQRVVNCLRHGMQYHMQDKNAQKCGREFMNFMFGEKGAEALIEDPDYYDEADIFLLSFLQAIRNPSSPKDLAIAIEVIFTELNESDECARAVIFDDDAMEAIVSAIGTSGRGPQFYNRAVSILCNFIVNGEEVHKATHFLERGGLKSIFNVMDSWRSFAYLQQSCILLLSTIVKNIPCHKRN